MASGDVTYGVYNSGYKYDNVSGAAEYYDSGDFELSDCLNEWGDSNVTINCWDCAQMVAIFSNALGADLDTYRMDKGGYGFLVNYISAIGRDWTNNPFGTTPRTGFGCHWVGWSQVYDSCLQVDNDDDPTSPGHSGLLPKNMTFNAGTPDTPYDDYRGKLVDPTDESAVTGTSYSPANVK